MAEERCAAAGIRLRVPRPGLCTDNGAMVAALGSELVARGVDASPPGPARRLVDADRAGAQRVTGWLLLAAAAVLLVVGAELFVENVAGAARRLGVTVVAVGVLLAGAEPEELLTAVVAALRDRPGLAVGDAVGANVTMLTPASAWPRWSGRSGWRTGSAPTPCCPRSPVCSPSASSGRGR